MHFPCEIPYEDLQVPPEEIADSRRHQFVALCREHHPDASPPAWLSWADVDAASALGLVPAGLGDKDVLETSDEWAPCFHRITGDDARRPISLAAAAEGVDWDTASLPAGAYLVEGYTWEPAINPWWPRPGVVHVVDGPGLDAPPALAMASDDDSMFFGEPLVLTGCVRAAPGSTLRGSWRVHDEGSSEWREFAGGVPVVGETFALSFVAPPEAEHGTIALRVEVTDPAQRSFTAYMRRLVVVLPGQADTTAGCDSSFIGACDSSDGETGAASTEPGDPSDPDGPPSGLGPGSSSSSSSGAPPTGAELGPRGCACGVAEAPAAAGLGLLGLLALSRRRRSIVRSPDPRIAVEDVLEDSSSYAVARAGRSSGGVDDGHIAARRGLRVVRE